MILYNYANVVTLLVNGSKSIIILIYYNLSLYYIVLTVQLYSLQQLTSIIIIFMPKTFPPDLVTYQ